MATNYREILRLAKLGYSQRSIAASAGCARSTVQRVLERVESNPHTLEELLALSDKGIQQALFPASSIPSTRKPPDYERVHRELAKNGVTLSSVEAYIYDQPSLSRGSTQGCAGAAGTF